MSQRAARHATAARELASDPITLADLLLVESDLRMREGDLEGAHRALMEHAERRRRDRPATRDDDAAPGVEGPHLPPRGASGGRRGRACPRDASGRRARARAPRGPEHEPDGGRECRCSRHGARRGRRRGERAPRSRSHAGDRLAARLARGVRHGARGDGPCDRPIQREAGFLLYLPQSLLPRAELDFRTGRWETAIAAADRGAFVVRGDAAAERGGIGVGSARPDGGCAGQRASSARRSRSAPSPATSSSACGALPPRRSEPSASSRSAPAGPRRRSLHSRRPNGISTLGAVGEPWLLMSAPDLVEALAHVGQGARAHDVLHDSEEQSSALGRVSGLAAAARCAGILDDEGRWQDAFEEALALHDRMPTPFERARTELCYAERLRRARKRAEARTRLRERARGLRRARRQAVVGARTRGVARERGESTSPLDARRRVDGAGARGREARRRRCDESRRRRDAVRQPEDDRVPPRQRLSQARGALAHGARAVVRARSSAESNPRDSPSAIATSVSLRSMATVSSRRKERP